MNLDDIDKITNKIKKNPIKTILSLIFLIVGIIFVTSLSSYTSAIVHILTINSNSEIKIENVLVGQNQNYNHIEVVIRNSFSEDILLNKLSFQAKIIPKFACCCPPTEALKIHEDVQILSSQKKMSLIGLFSKSSDKDITYKMHANIIDNNCSSVSFETTLDISIGIKSNSLSILYLEIPKSLNITNYEVTWGEAPKKIPTNWNTNFSKYHIIDIQILSTNGHIAKYNLKPTH